MIFPLLKFLLKKKQHLHLHQKRKVRRLKKKEKERDKLILLFSEKPVAVTPQPTITPISHHDVDTSQLKKPLSPAVQSLVLKYGIKDLGSIKASGNGGRILKGDVLAHLGLIKPKPAPKPTLSIAPPRDQIVFAQVKKVEKKQVIPTFISKDIKIDHLERSLNGKKKIKKIDWLIT